MSTAGFFLYTPLTIRPESIERSDIPDADNLYRFVWNGRTCFGTPFHKAVVEESSSSISKLLDEDRAHLTTPFTFEADGSGQPIHIATTRGNLQIVKLLLERRADVNARLKRGSREVYNVLNAAVFAENVGGSPRVVQHLLEARAEFEANSDNNLWPIHHAFITGSVELINLLRKEMKNRGVAEPDSTRSAAPLPAPLPLQLGIIHGRMSEVQLANAAPLTATSLKIFINHLPECILPFMARVMESNLVSAEMLAKLVTVQDLAKVLREAPVAACALLYEMSSSPGCDNIRWHPLPVRVSFARRHYQDYVNSWKPEDRRAGKIFTHWLRSLLKPTEWIMAFYETDNVWKYDLEKRTYPAWHRIIEDLSPGRPFADAEIKVCRVPNIISAEILIALTGNQDDASMIVFQNLIVRAIVSYVWWRGAVKVAILDACVRFWELAILVWSTASACQQGRNFGDRDISMRLTFVGFRGIVDLLHEMPLFWGYVRLGVPRSYFTVSRCVDVILSCANILLIFDSSRRLVLMVVVLSRWCQIFNCLIVTENLAVVVIPINRVLTSLMPPVLLTVLAFMAVSHGMVVIQDETHCDTESLDVRRFLEDLFNELFTDNIPRGIVKNNLQWMLTWTGVVVFSVFYMNIFIGIIGERYTYEKSVARLTVRSRRAALCSEFLLRCSVVPTGTWTLTAILIALVSCLVSVGVQISATCFDILFPGARYLFICCALSLYWATYQDTSACWSMQKEESHHYKPHHLWLVSPRADSLGAEEQLVDVPCSPNKSRNVQTKQAMEMLSKWGIGEGARKVELRRDNTSMSFTSFDERAWFRSRSHSRLSGNSSPVDQL